MKSVGLFEAKTRLSGLCAEVARTGQSIVITRRGVPWVRLEPTRSDGLSIRERRAAYLAGPGAGERDDEADFQVPRRSREGVRYDLP